MDDTFATLEALERVAIIATEAHQIGVTMRDDIEDLRIRQADVAGYSYAETTSISQELDRLRELVALIYRTLGITIRDTDGRWREVADVAHDLRSINPEIVLSFQELMHF